MWDSQVLLAGVSGVFSRVLWFLPHPPIEFVLICVKKLERDVKLSKKENKQLFIPHYTSHCASHNKNVSFCLKDPRKSIKSRSTPNTATPETATATTETATATTETATTTASTNERQTLRTKTVK